MKKTYLTLCVFLLLTTVGNTQQYLSFSQFSFNKGEFNPGYTGYKETFNVTLMHRSQWVGFEGAPSTQSLVVEAPFSKTKWSIAGRVNHDKIGPTNETTFGGDISYKLLLKKRRVLSFGAKVLGSLYQSNLTDLYLISDYEGGEDNQFIENQNGVFIPNIGFGMYYYSKDFYIGLSSPRMLRSKINKTDLISMSDVGRTAQVYYFMTGYTRKVHRNLSLVYNFTMLGTENSPLSMGVYFNMIMSKDYTVILSYHFKESVGLAFQWELDKKWKIGYSVDFATNSLIRTNYGSHEIMLNYTMKGKNKRIIYPRYF